MFLIQIHKGNTTTITTTATTGVFIKIIFLNTTHTPGWSSEFCSFALFNYKPASALNLLLLSDDDAAFFGGVAVLLQKQFSIFVE